MSAEAEIIYPAGRDVAIAGGKVMPIGPRQLSPAEIVGQIKDAVALPYSGADAEKVGMTLIEAAVFSAARAAADGDLDALEKILNRLMGKPVQQVISATGSLKEFLEHIAQSEEPPAPEVNPLDD